MEEPTEVQVACNIMQASNGQEIATKEALDGAPSVKCDPDNGSEEEKKKKARRRSKPKAPSGADDASSSNAAEQLPIETYGKDGDEAKPAGKSEKSAAAKVDPDFVEKIVKQVEFYFSDSNLPTDIFLMKIVTSKDNTEGWVQIKVLSTFRKIKNLKPKSNRAIADALRTSQELEVNEKGDSVRRVKPLPEVDLLEVQGCTVVAENLPEGSTLATIEDLFAAVGAVKMVRICAPGAKRSTAQSVGQSVLVSATHHALVEYHEQEHAKRAVKELTDDTNWRSGLRVRPLAPQNLPYQNTRSGEKKEVKRREEPRISFKGGQKGAEEIQDGHAVEEKAENSSAANPSSTATVGEEKLERQPDPSTAGTAEDSSAEFKKGGRRTKGGRKDYSSWASASAWQSNGKTETSPSANPSDDHPKTQDQRPRRLMLTKPVGRGPAGGEGHGQAAAGTPKKPDGTKGFSRGRGRATPLGGFPPSASPGAVTDTPKAE
mmetsp:Transcript_6685/g.11517  ORF Transcript_6685/g.11517 Transcript_6685/m.11517 type:complete len:488 (+) Transcript_6685:248-1711(+)|eukprot:CAMPEP_0198220552 /NCGR_PEP_ID=MMETSP1445-20131203/79617_1 /TAXON_ID=36898 /ORGANISM="Pyramimonas sp., Strain CCMP2087" /LENGTH=487 /DNA_ID=CAMNT_0043898375 /DNA_START=159 /DNA_END=1622 /DNA_ORIENTATION=+